MDKLGVINKALLKAGLPLAASLEDCDWNAALVFDDVAERLLRLHPWGFAQRFAVPAPLPEGPEFGYSHAYLVPEDCARLIDIRCQKDLRSPRARYRQVGGKVYTNASPCYLRYVAKVLEPDLWLPDFTDAVAALIATEIISLSGQNMGLVPQLLQMHELAMSKARLADARESMDRVPMEESIFVQAREGSAS